MSILSGRYLENHTKIDTADLDSSFQERFLRSLGFVVALLVCSAVGVYWGSNPAVYFLGHSAVLDANNFPLKQFCYKMLSKQDLVNLCFSVK